MKKKDDKIILDITYESDDINDIREYLNGSETEKYGFSIADQNTILFKPTIDRTYRLNLKCTDKHDEACMEFLSKIKDPSRLQPEYKLRKDKIQISFFITRLSEEEIDRELFNSGNIINDVDSKVLIGLFLDNRFHG